MKKLPQHIENKFFKFLNKEISIEEFEQWVYATDQLETVLSEHDYLNLIAFSFDQLNAFDYLEVMLIECLDFPKFEKYRICYLLNLLQTDDKEWQNTIKLLFEECVNSYNFLKAFFNLGFVIQDNKSNEKLMNEVYSLSKKEALNVLNWLNSEKIIIIGHQGHRKGANYLDNRTKEEKDSALNDILELRNLGINKSRGD